MFASAAAAGTVPKHAVYRVATVSALVLACACGIGGGRPTTPPPAAQPDASLGPGDTFEVAVYGHKDLSGKYRVGQDGTINFPLLGWVRVEGKEQTEVAKLIQEQLASRKILRSPHVSILVVEMESKQITVVGAVQKPGSFPHTRGLTIVQAISLAGGFTSLADRNETILTRRSGGKVIRFKVSVERVIEGREDDIPLQVGDTVYIPERIF